MQNPNVLALVEGKHRPIYISWNERQSGTSSGKRDLGHRPLPLTNRPGWQGAATGPVVSGVNFRFFPYHLPGGQQRPFHTADNLELLIFVFEGEIEFGIGTKAEELEWIRVKKFDTLFVPLGMGVGYRNPGKTDARYVMTSARVGEWPREVVYHLPGEKEPFVRPF